MSDVDDARPGSVNGAGEPGSRPESRIPADETPPTSPGSPILQSTKATEAVHAYAALSTIVMGEQPLGKLLRRVAELGVQTIPGADEVSVTLIVDGEARTVAFTGELAVSLDERQYEDGFGPCMDAARTGQTIWIEDTATTTDYEGFGRQARGNGIRQTLSVGMPTRGNVSGAMNIYSTGTTGPFGPLSRDVAATFAGYAAIALLNASAYNAALDEVANMQQAMASRAEIEQAKGIIMRDRACSADEAFDYLRDLSSRTHRKIRDLAIELIEQAGSAQHP